MAKCNPPNGWDAWLAAESAASQPLVADSVLQNIAATTGARSSDFTMCLAVACMKARRMVYFKVVAGDCGTNNLYITGTTKAEALGAGLAGKAASVDPEPISQGILSGLAAVFGAFTAHHAQAVQTEEVTLCQVSTTYNQAAVQIENAVQLGAMSTDQAAQLISQIAQQLDPMLATIYKSCNASCGYRIALKALVAYNSQIVYAALAPHAVQGAPPVSLAPPPVASPGAPGTYVSNPPAPNVAQIPNAYPVPPQYPSSPSLYVGASGAIAIPLNANNGGQNGIPSPISFDPGTIILIGGIAFVASKI